MRSNHILFSAPLLSTSVLLGVLAGCSLESQPTPVAASIVEETGGSSPTVPLASTVDDSQKKIVDPEHPHKPGSHGGIIIPIGSDSYHAEAVIEVGGDFRLMMLGKDESRIQEVEVQPVKAYAKAVGDPDSTAIEMTAVP